MLEDQARNSGCGGLRHTEIASSCSLRRKMLHAVLSGMTRQIRKVKDWPCDQGGTFDG